MQERVLFPGFIFVFNSHIKPILYVPGSETPVHSLNGEYYATR